MVVLAVQAVLEVQQRVVTVEPAVLEAMEVLQVMAEVAALPTAAIVALTVKDLSRE
jgi:hypothetical protein